MLCEVWVFTQQWQSILSHLPYVRLVMFSVVCSGPCRLHAPGQCSLAPRSLDAATVQAACTSMVVHAGLLDYTALSVAVCSRVRSILKHRDLMECGARCD